MLHEAMRPGVAVRLLAGLFLALLLAACGADKTWAPDDAVRAARFVAGPPASLTLFTIVNDRSGSGAHTALLINGDERVLYDPAGTWTMPGVPVQGDIHYGMTDRAVGFYRAYHARDREEQHFHVVEQRITVRPEVAALALQEARSYGAAPKAFCTRAVSTVLRALPGFGALPATFFPNTLRTAFGTLPGVEERVTTQATAPADHGIILVDRAGNRVN